MEEVIREARAFRRKIVDEIQYLIDFLDGLDGDTDMEDGGDYEPSLGWPIGLGGKGAAGREDGPAFDAGSNDVELDESDLEPSLASPERHPSLAWNAGLMRDRGGAQTHWASGGWDEREDQCDDEGFPELRS